MLVFMYSSLYSRQILMKLEFSQQIFGKKAQISDFMKVCLVGTEWYMRTDRHDKPNGSFSLFCERA